MTSPRLRFALAALLTLLALATAGCSSKRNRTDPPPEFTQAEADDIAQMIGTTMASDLGGWILEIERTLEKRRNAVVGDTTEAILRGAINHNLNFVYENSLGASGAVWDTSIVSVDVHDVGVGTFAEVAIKGPYRHISDISIVDANEDTMAFNGLATDTSLFTVKSFTRGDTTYYHMNNFFDYQDTRLDKNQTTAWPIDGKASWLVDATKYASIGGAAQRRILVEMSVTFNGTQTPPAEVSELPDEPPIFRYTVDLKTGTVVRQ